MSLSILCARACLNEDFSFHHPSHPPRLNPGRFSERLVHFVLGIMDWVQTVLPLSDMLRAVLIFCQRVALRVTWQLWKWGDALLRMNPTTYHHHHHKPSLKTFCRPGREFNTDISLSTPWLLLQCVHARCCHAGCSVTAKDHLASHKLFFHHLIYLILQTGLACIVLGLIHAIATSAFADQDCEHSRRRWWASAWQYGSRN